MPDREPAILVINPGSTSTKLAVYEGETMRTENTVRHKPEVFSSCASVLDQIEIRLSCLFDFLSGEAIDPAGFDAVVGRGGLLKPVVSGTYIVGDVMLRDLHAEGAGSHASSLGALMAAEFAGRYGIPAYIVDPVVVDELMPIARLSGVPGIERRSIFHALNAKTVARRCAAALGMDYAMGRFVVAHMGGGISVGAHRLGRVVDVNDALYGDGPFSPERCGTVPLRQIIERCYSGSYTREQMLALLTREGGVIAYLGTNDMIEVEARIERGDCEAELVFNAMAYQVAKEIGAMVVALDGHADAIILTGGLARSKYLVERIKQRVEPFAQVFCYPGEEEMHALAMGALRVLSGQENAMDYPEGGNAR